jgi:flagellar biosynthesis/type III secretory pathway protein FliH
MSNLIRSTKVSAELKVLSATRSLETCKIVGIPQLQAHSHIPSSARTDGADVSVHVSQATGAAAPSSPADYPEYEKRFARELTALRTQALAAAREEGLQQGRQAGKEECTGLLTTLQALIASAHAAQVRGIEKVADDAAEIALMAVGKILGEGFLSRATAVAAVREAVRRCQGREKLHVRVAPEQFALLDERKEEWLEGAVANEVTLVADEQIRYGGCVIESASGTLDARLETQFQRLRETLRVARAEWEAKRG